MHCVAGCMNDSHCFTVRLTDTRGWNVCGMFRLQTTFMCGAVCRLSHEMVRHEMSKEVTRWEGWQMGTETLFHSPGGWRSLHNKWGLWRKFDYISQTLGRWPHLDVEPWHWWTDRPLFWLTARNYTRSCKKGICKPASDNNSPQETMELPLPNMRVYMYLGLYIYT